MSKMNAPKMEVVRFKEADVIVASGAKTMSWTGFGDGNASNNKITFGNGTEFEFGGSAAADVLQTIYDNTGANSTTSIWNEFRKNEPEKQYAALDGVVSNLVATDTSAGTWNYTYVYDAGNNRFNKQ